MGGARRPGKRKGEGTNISRISSVLQAQNSRIGQYCPPSNNEVAVSQRFIIICLKSYLCG